MTCFIIDENEINDIEVLKSYIEQMPQLKLIGSSIDPMNGLQKSTSYGANLVFIDAIIVEKLGERYLGLFPSNTQFVFTSNNIRYLINAFDNQVSGFLLKPFDFDYFYETVIRLERLNFRKTFKINNDHSNNVFIPTGVKGRVIQLDAKEILFIKSQNDLVYIYTYSKEYIVNIRLKEAEIALNHMNFARIHRAFIINIDFIEVIDGTHVHLRNSISIPFGDFYRQNFLDRIYSRFIQKRI